MSRHALIHALRDLSGDARRPLASSQIKALERHFGPDLPPCVRDYLSIAGARRGPATLLDVTPIRTPTVSPFAFTVGTWLRDASQILDQHATIVEHGGPRRIVPLASSGKGRLLCARRKDWDADILSWDEELSAAFVVAPSFAEWVRHTVING